MILTVDEFAKWAGLSSRSGATTKSGSPKVGLVGAAKDGRQEPQRAAISSSNNCKGTNRGSWCRGRYR